MNLTINNFAVENGSYLVTVTLKPNMYQFPARKQFDLTFDKLCSRLQRFCDKYLVVAELTEKTNIHYHAIVKWTKYFEHAKDRFVDYVKHNRIGLGYVQVNGDAIQSTNNKPLEYMKKDLKKTYVIVNGKNRLRRKLYDIYDRAVENEEIRRDAEEMAKYDTSDLDRGLEDYLIREVKDEEEYNGKPSE